MSERRLLPEWVSALVAEITERDEATMERLWRQMNAEPPVSDPMPDAYRWTPDMETP